MRLLRKTKRATAKNLARLKAWLDEADTIVIGAGSGLSTAAGFTYAGTRFEQTFLILWRATG